MASHGLRGLGALVAARSGKYSVGAVTCELGATRRAKRRDERRDRMCRSRYERRCGSETIVENREFRTITINWTVLNRA